MQRKTLRYIKSQISIIKLNWAEYLYEGVPYLIACILLFFAVIKPLFLSPPHLSNEVSGETHKTQEMESRIEASEEEETLTVRTQAEENKTPKTMREEVLDYLRQQGYDERSIAVWDRIITKETGGTYDPLITPPTVVKHCKGVDGWYVVEIDAKGRQANCRNGDLEGRNERSFGLFQILPSTWERYKCAGEKMSWKDQVHCAIKLQQKDGFSKHWNI